MHGCTGSESVISRATHPWPPTSWWRRAAELHQRGNQGSCSAMTSPLADYLAEVGATKRFNDMMNGA
jgi:hypothetical protein